MSLEDDVHQLRAEASKAQAAAELAASVEARRVEEHRRAITQLLDEFAAEMRKRGVATVAVYEYRTRDHLFGDGWSGPTRSIWAGARIGQGWRVYSLWEDETSERSSDRGWKIGAEMVLLEDGRLVQVSWTERRIGGFIKRGKVRTADFDGADARHHVGIDGLRMGMVSLLAKL